MPDLIRTLQGDLAAIITELGQDAELLLKAIDMKRLLEEGREYLMPLTVDFIEQHFQDVEAGIVKGEKFGETVLKNGKHHGD